MFDLFIEIMRNYLNNIWEILFFTFLIAIFGWIIADLVYRLRHK